MARYPKGVVTEATRIRLDRIRTGFLRAYPNLFSDAAVIILEHDGVEC